MAGVETLTRIAKVENNSFPAILAKKIASKLLNAETAKINEKIFLENEWQKQTKRFIELGFHKELNLTEKKYLESLPKFKSQPKKYKGRLDIPVIVETRIPLVKMLELLNADCSYGVKNVACIFDIKKIKDWDEIGFKPPKMPYVTWLNDGACNNLNKSANEVRQNLKSDERGGNIYDGIALYLRKPEILNNYFIGLCGSQSSFGNSPYLGYSSPESKNVKIFHEFTNLIIPNCAWITAGKIKI